MDFYFSLSFNSIVVTGNCTIYLTELRWLFSLHIKVLSVAQFRLLTTDYSRIQQNKFTLLFFSRSRQSCFFLSRSHSVYVCVCRQLPNSWPQRYPLRTKNHHYASNALIRLWIRWQTAPHRSFSNSSLDYLLIPNNTAINYFIFTFQVISSRPTIHITVILYVFDKKSSCAHWMPYALFLERV